MIHWGFQWNKLVEFNEINSMKIYTIKYFILLFSLMLSCNGRKVEKNTSYETPFSEYESANLPVIFHEGTVSTSMDKYNTAFSPDQSMVFYTATSKPDRLGLTGIAYQKFENGKFQTAEFVPFVSFENPVTDVQISPDGQLMLFSTFKDYPGKPEGFNFNIWISSFQDSTWSQPSPFGPPVHSSGNEFYPVMVGNGDIYFTSDKAGSLDIYRSELGESGYLEPVRLPDYINSPSSEADAFVSQDRSIMVFVRVDEPDGFGNSDLYICFKEEDGNWSEPKNMGENINSEYIDGSPYITPDLRFMIFTSNRTNPKLKQKAVSGYKAFKQMHNSTLNGSLNFYIVKFNPDDFR